MSDGRREPLLQWEEALNKVLDLATKQLDTIERVLDSYYNEYGDEDPDPGDEDEDEDEWDDDTATPVVALVDARTSGKSLEQQDPLRVAAENTP